MPFPLAGYGPAPAGMPRRRKLVLAAVVVAVVLIAGLIAGIALGGKPKGSLALPRTLLGLPQATSAGARHLAATFKAQEQAGANGKLTGVVAGIYGNPAGAWLAISGGGICGTCSLKSPGAVRSNLTAHGFAGAALYPAGPTGGVLACGSRASQDGTLIRCTWVDGRTARLPRHQHQAAIATARIGRTVSQGRQERLPLKQVHRLSPTSREDHDPPTTPNPHDWQVIDPNPAGPGVSPPPIAALPPGVVRPGQPA